MQVLKQAMPTVKLAFAGLALLASLAGGTAEARSPYSEAELRAVESQDESKVRELREQEITQLRIVLGRRQPVNRQADLYFRLAEIYLEGYHAAFLLEGRAHEKRLEKGIEDKFIDRKHSVPFLRNGIKACQEVIKTGIAYEKMDHIYYFLAFNNAELGNRQESVNYFDKLARQYPQSPFVSEAYKELGDASFENKEYDKARQYYDLALRKAPPEIAPRILHKLAWTYYRMKQHDRAVETMKRTIETAQKSGEKFVNLKEEALRDMAIFMTESGRVEEAIAYLREKSGDPKFYAKALERLGAQYERSVQPEKAALVYDSLLKTNPDSEEAFRVTVKLVDLDLRRNRYNEALKRIQAVQVPGKREGPTEVAAQNLKSMTRRTATEHHEKFRRAQTRISLQIAEDYYTVYLTSFLAKEDSRQETPEIEMYLAEVKREMGKAKEASLLYRKVLDSKDKRYAKEAGALWIASLVEALKKDPGARSGKTEPSEIERQFVEAADLMQETIGETPEAREASLRAAQVLAGYASTRKESIQRIRKVIARWPRSPQAQTAARLWVQLQSDRITAAAKDSSGEQADALKGMDEAIAEIRGNAELMAGDADSGQGKLKLLLADQDTKIRIGAITKSESDKDYATAAKGYERFAVESKDKEQAEKAYASTVASYLKADDGASAERVLGTWLKRFPKSPRAVELSRSASSQFLIQGRFEAAGSLFERLGREAGDPDSLETAARIFDGLGDRVRARRAWSSYLSSYKSSPNRFAVALTLARSYESAGQDADAAAAYKACFKTSSPLEPECGARLADLYFRTRNPEAGKAALARVAANRSPAAKKKPKKAPQAESSGPANSPFVGYARYRLAEMLEKSKRFDPITLPEAKLTRAVKQRLDFLEPLARAYTLAVDAGGPWAISALDRLAAFAYTFADDLDAIPLPDNVDAQTAAKFRAQLKTNSDPLRKRALDTWKEAYTKAVQAEVLAPVIPEIADRLSDLNPHGTSRAQGHRGKLRVAGVAPDAGSDALARTRERLLKSSAAAADAETWVDYGNLLWGEGKPGLARIAYDRAVGLNKKNGAALNNRATLLVSGDGQEDWFAAAEALQLFREAARQDDLLLARFNRASLLNYYRVFAKAKPLWDQILTRNGSPETFDGLATAEQGLGSPGQAEADFKKGTDAGGKKSRFANVFHDAARKASVKGGAEDCLERLEDLDDASPVGFEKQAAERLRKACTQWKAKSGKPGASG